MLLAPFRKFFAFPQTQQPPQLHAPGRLRERSLADQMRFELGKPALVATRKLGREILAHDKREHRVAEKLQAFVLGSIFAAPFV